MFVVENTDATGDVDTLQVHEQPQVNGTQHESVADADPQPPTLKQEGWNEG